MNWSNRLSWLSALKVRPADGRSTEPDRADMGTAYGLDASFGPAEPPAHENPLPPPWEHRLTRRSSL